MKENKGKRISRKQFLGILGGGIATLIVAQLNNKFGRTSKLFSRGSEGHNNYGNSTYGGSKRS